MNYYNEFDPKAAAWLRVLIAEKIIPEGVVDERSIKEVRGSELVGYEQCHFFAGVAGWSRALQLANWPADRPVWTGSCPCQPLSCAGKRGGEKDERHLWPEFYRLISKCRPATIIGEQVASPDGLEWLDGVSLDLEELNYAFAASDLPSASVRSPNKRQRCYWVANTISTNEQQWSEVQWQAQPARRGSPCRLGESESNRLPRSEGARNGRSSITHDGRLVQPNSAGFVTREPSCTPAGHGSSIESASGDCRSMEDSKLPEGTRLRCDLREVLFDQKAGGFMRSGSEGFWDNAIWHECQDGKIRRIPTEPAFFPLAHGIPGRVAMLKGFGNAINPELAAEFIRAFLEAEKDLVAT